MVLGQIAAAGPEPAGQSQRAASDLVPVHGMTACEVIGDALAYEIGHRAVLKARLRSQRVRLRCGQLDLCTVHDDMITRVMSCSGGGSTACTPVSVACVGTSCGACTPGMRGVPSCIPLLRQSLAWAMMREGSD